ncbi:hypothetical protein Tco_0952454 [Tanacetum coccineum]|uniref:Uncharacterized protein n=1 Tax=Tanacetum coccineum TaxID=301880 RepID=A0ABQ5E2Y7_9ASTR
MPTEMELTLEQTQQGVSYEVSVFTMKMEILLEPTSNKLMVEHAEYDESNTYVLERFNTTAGNPVKKILLKLNLSDHRKLKEGGEVMSDLEHSTVSYTSISLDSDPSAWGISLMDAGEVPEMDPYKDLSQQGNLVPLSPTYAPDPMELEHRVPVYVPKPVKDLEEDPIDYVVDVNDDEDKEESSKDEGDEEEEHLDLANSTAVASPAIDLVPSAEETEPFET